MKFILTKELGRLAKWLRILGFDTLYFNPSQKSPGFSPRDECRLFSAQEGAADFSPRGSTQDNISSLIIQALRDERIILTRNHRLPQGRGIKILLIKNERIKEQLAEVLKTLEIKPDSKSMFTRCIICNEQLVGIEKEEIKDKVPEYVFKTQENFITCPKCKRIYWQGTHWGNVAKTLEEITSM